ncbi:uncharacterized protein G2W53_010369 [Senna tora]|uniref:Secreted protein n=1 Tax=Senna tora TaxID=362788 RepID=A0A834X0K0_9FABA|nr:uncharacterized protein G2W53_010369 [Senna tora]
MTNCGLTCRLFLFLFLLLGRNTFTVEKGGERSSNNRRSNRVCEGVGAVATMLGVTEEEEASWSWSWSRWRFFFFFMSSWNAAAAAGSDVYGIRRKYEY